MARERVLSTLGYDPELIAQLPVHDRAVLRAEGLCWLAACAILALAAGYASYLVLPIALAPLFAGPGIALLTLNLLRILIAGGGAPLATRLARGEKHCQRYRPTLIPAIVFGVLAALLSQPAQLPFWPELDQEVEVHRQLLIAQHDLAAKDLGNDPEYYREQLQAAGFPVFRLKRIWRDPARALRYTSIICLLVLLPALWSQLISLRSRRAYELLRYRRAHAAASRIQREGRAQVAAMLSCWPSFVPAEPWQGAAYPKKSGPWIVRTSP